MKIAILIPTMNRPEFIERVVAYYNSLNSPHPIYIGDASNPEVAVQTVNNLKQFRNVEVNYFHWQGVNTLRTIVKLAEEAGKECQFCAFSGDDDYFIPSSLTRCAGFLAGNKSYRTAQGRAAIFELDRAGAYGKIRSLSQYWGENSLEQETGLERVESFRKKYFVMQFSVHRTDEFLIDSELYKEIKDYSLSEAMHCFIFAIKGRSKFLDCLYMVRSNHDDRVYTALGFVDWVMRPGWSSECNEVIDILSRTLQETDNLSLNQPRSVIRGAFKEMFEKHSFKSHPINRNANFLSYLKHILPVDLKNTLRPLHNLSMGVKDMRLLRSKRSYFYEDFLPVERSLTRHVTSNN